MTYRVEQRERDGDPWEVLGSPQFGYAVGLDVDAAHDVARTVRSRGLFARLMEEPEGGSGLTQHPHAVDPSWNSFPWVVACPECGGCGWTTVPVCCGRPYAGDCCGSPEPAQAQCGTCQGTGMRRDR